MGTQPERVRNTLSAATKGRQISWEHISLAGEFFFNLSLGVRIDLYAETALSDSLFVLDEAKASHRVIGGLKSSTWPQQNPAMAEFTAAVANRASIDDLFVVGRNLYQAACGGSNAAVALLDDLASRTSGFKDDKRKAVLDGMVFEGFFDPNAQLRKNFKMGRFESLFDLQRHKDRMPSFEFIAECLLPEARRFHAVLGKRHGSHGRCRDAPRGEGRSGALLDKLAVSVRIFLMTSWSWEFINCCPANEFVHLG